MIVSWRRRAWTCAVVLFAMAFVAAPACAFAITATSTPYPAPARGANSWYWPLGASVAAPAPGWLAFRTWYSLSNKAWHLAWDDMGKAAGQPVYALTWGRVDFASMRVNGYGWNYNTKTTAPGGAIVIRYRASDGTYFKALYGHVDFNETSMTVGTVVAPGQRIAVLNHYANIPHVHFAIRPGTSDPKPLSVTPTAFRKTVGMLMGHTFEWTPDASRTPIPQTYGFVDPARFLRTHTPWTRIAARPGSPRVPSRVTRRRTFTVNGSFNATKVPDACSVTIAGMRLERTGWVERAHWHGTIPKATSGAASYSVRVCIPSRGTWRLVASVPSRMDWTGGASNPSARFTVR